MSGRILVTGASGGLGRAATRVLREAGWQVVVHCRSPFGDGPDSPEAVVGDATTQDWAPVVRRCDAVIHLAAAVHQRPRDAGAQTRMHLLNVEATTRLAEACRVSGAKLVFASSIAVYGGGHEDVISEDHPLHPETLYGATKALAERAIEGMAAGGLRATILRFPLLFGPFGRGNLERMLGAIMQHRYWPVGPSATRKSCLAFDDASRAILLALKPDLDRRALIVSPPVAPTLGEIHDAAYAACGKRRPPDCPRGIALSVARAVDAMAGLSGRVGEREAQVRVLTGRAEFDGSRFATLTGFTPRLGILEALQLTASHVARGQS